MGFLSSLGNYFASPGGKALTSLGTNLYGAYTAKKAAGQQVDSANQAIAGYNTQYAETRNNLAPWLQSGRNALAQLQNPIKNFLASPDYEFRRNEGMRGIQQSAAAKGSLYSGNALKALNEYNSNLASQEFGNYFNRQSQLADRGQNAAANQGAFGAQNAGFVGNALMDAGNAQASGTVGAANSLTEGLSRASDVYQYGSGVRNAFLADRAGGLSGLSFTSGTQLPGTIGNVGAWGGTAGEGTVGSLGGSGLSGSGLTAATPAASPYTWANVYPGLAAGAAAFGIAALGNHLLGNDRPWELNEGLTYDADTGRASAGNFSAPFSTGKGLLSNTNGTRYQDQTGRTFEVPLLNGRTGNHPPEIYAYLQRQGAQLPDYATFLGEYQALGAHQ